MCGKKTVLRCPDYVLCMYALVSSGNESLLRLLRDLGLLTQVSREGDIKCVEVDLRNPGV